jgi:glycosyltransferase involved in cell wall biosynthesis
VTDLAVSPLTQAGAADAPVVVAVFVPDHAERFLPALRSLRRLGYPIVLGTDRASRLGALSDLATGCVETWSAANLVNDVWNATHKHVLAITDSVSVPDDFLGPALDFIEGDARVGTVSFLSNAASILSVPHGRPVEKPEMGHDASSATRLLRGLRQPASPVPIPVAAGGAILISATALSTIGFLRDAPSGSFAPAIADFSCRARERGLFDVLDQTTFYACYADLSIEPLAERTVTGLTLDDNGWLHDRHPLINDLAADERGRPNSPLRLALRSAEVKLLGLRVLIDGSCLGPQEMGTQVATTALIGALADTPEVKEVCVALPGPVPGYAAEVFARRNVRAETVLQHEELARFGRCDVVHRPFQPGSDFAGERWRQYADRVLFTIHDLISFHIGSYSGTAGEWLRYRNLIRQAVREADGVVVISEDVRQQLAFECLQIDPTAVFVVPNGTEHLTGTEEARLPRQLLEKDFSAAEFVLCLGTDYSHKNRDLAIHAYAELRKRGWPGKLVLVGPSVPWGSSRAAEAAAIVNNRVEDEDVLALPDLPFLERNWLLRHASLVLYPTSAEGFGLVPFEAARFGTPTVFVGFGPLAEFAGDQPVMASDWSPDALADAAEQLLGDPALARRQIETCLAAGTHYTWERAAKGLVAAYLAVLSSPPR